ncbi:lipid A deacylase LpxR family protein [Pedosphaera parvula]|uniref:lipid A deacylase LpxR family protein n=1 Tax=Pedosphaera parvula TaxID=1032527 RepID=UPI0003112640|nr:lipid A deacylase LpxR family protein [Pedosphaera parvula]
MNVCKRLFRRAAVWGILSVPLLSFAQSYNQGPVFSAIEENDLVVKTDRHYTQGIKLSYLQRDGVMPELLDRFSKWVPTLGFELGTNKFGYTVGQNIYTPADIQQRQFIPNDRPYAGWLYTGLALQRRGSAFSDQVAVLEHLELDLGVIGPWSLANEAQTWVHELRGFATPKGWNHQLHNEPGLDLKFERSWRWPAVATRPWGIDFIPRVGFNLGNVETSARINGTVRAGWHLPDDFGPHTIDSITLPEGGISPGAEEGENYGVYIFGSAQSKGVAYTAFLDGNLWQASPHVEKKNYITELSTGIVLQLNPVELGFTYVYRTREFVLQTERDSYGSIFISGRF